jgi:hypothetical protein
MFLASSLAERAARELAKEDEMNARMTPDPRPRRRKLLRFGTCLAGCLVVALAAVPPASASRVLVRPSAGPGLCCEADVVAQGPDNSLLYYHTLVSNVLLPQWRSTQIAGPGTTYSAPSIFVRPDNEADIVAEGPDNSLLYFHATSGSAWRWAVIAGAGTTFSAPSIFVRSDGEADVVAEGPDNSLRYYHAWPGSPWDPGQIGPDGTTFSAPAIFVRSGGEADVVAEGADHTMWYWHATPGSSWGSMHFPGAVDYSAPAIMVRSGGEADIAFQGPGNSLRLYFATPGSNWSASAVAGAGTTYSAPAITADDGGGGPYGVAGGPEIAVEGPDYSLSWYFLQWSAGPTGQPEGPTGWNGGKVGSAAGITFSAPSIVDRGGGEVDFAFVGVQNSLWYYAQTGYGPVEPSQVSGYDTAFG